MSWCLTAAFEPGRRWRVLQVLRDQQVRGHENRHLLRLSAITLTINSQALSANGTWLCSSMKIMSSRSQRPSARLKETLKA